MSTRLGQVHGLRWLAMATAALVVGVPSLALPAAAQAPTGDVAAPVRAYYTAWRASDIDGVLATLAAGCDYRYGTTAQFEAQGRAAIGPVVERLLAAPGSARAYERQVQVDGERVTWTWEFFYDPLLAALGIPDQQGGGEAVVRDGQIVAFTGWLDPHSDARRRSALNAVAASRAAAARAVTPPVGPGALPRAANTQDRGAPTVAPWIVAAGLALLLPIAAVVAKRPSPAR